MAKSKRREQPDPDPKKQAEDERRAYEEMQKQIDKKRNVN